MNEPKQVFYAELPVMVMKRFALIARNEEELKAQAQAHVDRFSQAEYGYKLEREKVPKGTKGNPPLKSHMLSKDWQDNWNEQ